MFLQFADSVAFLFRPYRRGPALLSNSIMIRMQCSSCSNVSGTHSRGLLRLLDGGGDEGRCFEAVFWRAWLASECDIRAPAFISRHSDSASAAAPRRSSRCTGALKHRSFSTSS